MQKTITTQEKLNLLHGPAIAVARLTLTSYLYSGWMWAEFVLVLVFFAALFFPYAENTSYFNGTSTFTLGAIAILGPAIMVRQATGARTYLILARLTSRSAYSRGLILATAFLRIPLYLFFLLLVLLTHRLTDPTPATLFWGMIGILPNTITIAALTVCLSSPIATRRKRIYFLVWLALVLFSIRPILNAPAWLSTTLSIIQLPLWPLGACYNMSLSGTLNPTGLLGVGLLVLYCSFIGIVAGYWLGKRDLLLH